MTQRKLCPEVFMSSNMNIMVSVPPYRGGLKEQEDVENENRKVSRR
jgi:hypothetical protein